MQKVLSLLTLGVLTISAFGQAKQPSTGQTTGKTTQKKSTSVSKPSTSDASRQRSEAPSRKTTAVKSAPTPEPTPPPDPEADKKRFEEALAATSSAEKARLLRIFLDEFPVTSYAEEAVEYLVTSRAMTGSERLESGDVNQALASFRLAVDESPNPVPDRLYNDVLLKSVLNLYHRGQQKAALDLAGRIEKKVAGNAKQLLGLASFYLGTENGAEARRLAESAIAVDPTSASAYQALGLANRLNFDLEASSTAYAKAAELDPGSAPAKRSLAEMKRALGKPDEALAIYRAILAANEADTVARTGLVLSLFEAGKRTEAETELAAALERDPRNFTLLAGVGYWYAANGQGAKAVEYGQKAVEAEPRYVWGHIALGRGLIKENRPVDAERALVRAKQYGNFPTLDYEIASARFAAGLFREAVEELGKNFTVKDGTVHTKLGGRVASEGKSFQEALGNERRASILAPVAADDIDMSDKMRLLFEINRKAEASTDEAELSALADAFVRGDDKMKLHRQLHVSQLFLQKNIALPKVAEWLKASLGNADAGLDVAAPGAAVMANELYESRTVAFSRNEVLLIPDVPRQTLSAILRGRIEELSGWALYQQKSYPEAAVRLRRAVSVMPEKSAWWRSSMWRLGTALEADGKDKEALDSYIQSYKIDRPSPLRYGVVESLYVKVHGSREGLEDLIGANPQSAVSSLPQKADPKPSPAASSELPKADSRSAVQEPALRPAEAKEVPSVQKTAEQVQKFDNKALLTEKENDRVSIASKQEPDVSKAVETAKKVTTPLEKPSDPAAADEKAEVAERKIEKPPIIVKSAEARPPDTSVDEKTVDKKAADVVPLAELLKKKWPADSVETDGVGPVPSAEVATKQLLPVPEPPKFPEAISSSTEASANPADKVTDQKEVPTEKAASEKDENTAAPEPKKEIVKDSAADMPAEQPKTDPPKAGAEPAADKVPPKTESVNLLRDPFAESATNPSEKKVPKTEVVVDDPLKSSKAAETTKPESRSLFEPIVITVPQTWKPTGKPTDAIKVDTEDSTSAKPGKAAGDRTSTGATRTRVIAGKDVSSDQRCSIEVSDESISLLNGGGSLGILITIVGDGKMNELTASTNSPRDLEVKPEPEIEGLPGRRFYVVKSVSTRTGMFNVNFESPCGKKEITVRVR